MHKSVLLITLTFVFFIPASAQKKSDREQANLDGAVKSVRSQSTRYGDVSSAQPLDTKQLDIVVYDTIGNEIHRTIYSTYGFLAGKEVKTYDAKGNLAKSVLSDEKGAIISSEVFLYANGELAQMVTYDPKGSARFRRLNSYGPNGRLEEQTYYSPKKPAGRTVFKYDQGNISEVAFYLPDGSKSVASIGPCLGAHKLTYSYDEKGRVLKTIAYEPNGDLIRSWQYFYDPKGQVAEDTRETAWSRTKFAYTYEYDSHGNWIKQTATITDQPKPGEGQPTTRKTVTTREIVYY